MSRQLDDIVGQKFSDMTFEEQLEFIRNVRKSRRTQKATSKVVKKVKRTATKRIEKAKSAFDNLSDADKLKLLEKLKNAES